MFWTDEVLNKVDRTKFQVVNDSKTPSGDPHVGSLRGVIIHDAVYKVLRNNNIDAKYIFGSDDYDPLDEIPKGQDEHFVKYLGMPLCNVPAPPGSQYENMADHFINGFFEIFKKLGVEAETYKVRDFYRGGKFNEAIDKILSNADKIRQIYKTVSGSEKSAKWYPFQSICENCGRIGTTEVIDYDGKEVTYICRPNMVKWAQGCGHTGKRSPFDGQGKLPWKLEWVAKWMTLGITIEGAGMDHTTKGGSRDVAVSVLQDIFHLKAPLNIPYGFFLVEGSKMSSSKGIGSTARDMADFLAPEILRFLMLGTPPKRAINFSPTEKNIVKIYNDFDLTRNAVFSPQGDNSLQKQLYAISELNNSEDYTVPGFSLVKTLVQLPHIDIFAEAEKIKGSALTPLEKQRLESRIHSTKYWLATYATEEEKFEIQEELPADTYSKLGPGELGFIKRFVSDLESASWEENAIQQQVFNSARLTPIESKAAFKAIYHIFLKKDRGPQVGRLLYYLGRDVVFNRLKEVKVDSYNFWKHSSLSREEFESFLEQEKQDIVDAGAQPEFIAEPKGGDSFRGMGVIEFSIKKTDKHLYMKRVAITDFEGKEDSKKEAEQFQAAADEYIKSIQSRYAQEWPVTQSNSNFILS